MGHRIGTRTLIGVKRRLHALLPFPRYSCPQELIPLQGTAGGGTSDYNKVKDYAMYRVRRAGRRGSEDYYLRESGRHHRRGRPSGI